MPNPEISLKEQFKIWTHVAAHSFGGPAGQIAVIHKVVVEEKKIISEERFLHALNFCMLLPGPEAQQLATYMGWIINRWRGGLIAGGLFILPGFFSILLLSYIYVLYRDITIVQGLFYGMKPAIIAIVIAALYKISKKSLKKSFHWSLAILAFLALFIFNIPFPIVVVSSALLGILYGHFILHDDPSKDLNQLKRPPFSDTIKTVLTWIAVWFFPIVVIFFIFGPDSTFHKLNLFFSEMSLVTFGGAYAALSFVAQKAVNVYGWLQGTQMLDGLALAETTPGPLIQVVQYVGFMGAYRFPDIANPYLSAFLGSVLTTWMTFAPCFLWIFSFAPYVEFIRGLKVFSHALTAITASVVGVIFNLSLWFVLKVLFKETAVVESTIFKLELPIWNTVDFYALSICAMALSMQFIFKKSMMTILGTCIILGIITQYVQ